MELSRVSCLTVLVILWCVGVHPCQDCELLDAPCVPRYMQANRSAVCVCNATYCDTLVREHPSIGAYVAYTSSNAGLRFQKSFGQLQKGYENCETLYVLNPIKLHQAIIGFGGAVTDSAGFTWKTLSPEAQEKLIQTYFSDLGSEYNVIRTPVGGCDFSLRLYAYNELPVNDSRLSNYSLSEEDYTLKMPMIIESQKMATEKIMVVGTTWSPPPWMKTNNAFTGHSRLLKEYYQTYADYHCLFAEKYKEVGIDLWGFTTTNEPLNGVFSLTRFQTLGFNASGMGEFIEYNLGPTLKRTCSVPNLGIMAVDDQRTVIPLFFNALNEYNPGAMEYIDGIAVHWYLDEFTPATLLSDLIRDYPEKFIMATEACAGFKMSDYPKVDLGSWERANDYITDIIEDLRNKVSGWIDWNLCLDMQGGPNWSQNYVDAAIIVDALADEFYKQPTFYALAHFSKFLPPGSRRISVLESPTTMDPNIFFDSDDKEPNYDHVAFLTPRNTIVVIIHNKGIFKTVTVQLGDQHIVVTLESESITTIEFQYDTSMIYRDMPEYVANARR